MTGIVCLGEHSQLIFRKLHSMESSFVSLESITSIVSMDIMLMEDVP